ncbi:hypothetical protein [Desulfogranum japonicum]|uniref:hypothetical protein n=1 Tax=Desulfogranum japonicum TaxID=231447 RepID=UPI0003FDF868|nr:hypothetical protein [Desulfogranum japonicum]
MGGRSRKVQQEDRWDFVKELSDYRLQQYGLMTRQHINQGDDDIRKGAFNYELAIEYYRRNGSAPSWYTDGPALNNSVGRRNGTTV